MPADQEQRIARRKRSEHHRLEVGPTFQTEGAREEGLRSLHLFGLGCGRRGLLRGF